MLEVNKVYKKEDGEIVRLDTGVYGYKQPTEQSEESNNEQEQ